MPREVEAIANGQKGEVTPDGERTTWEWSTTEPMATYLATIVVGQFTIIEQTGPNGTSMAHAVADNEVEAGAQHLQDTARMIDYFDEFLRRVPARLLRLDRPAQPIGFRSRNPEPARCSEAICTRTPPSGPTSWPTNGLVIRCRQRTGTTSG